MDKCEECPIGAWYFKYGEDSFCPYLDGVKNEWQGDCSLTSSDMIVIHRAIAGEGKLWCFPKEWVLVSQGKDGATLSAHNSTAWRPEWEVELEGDKQGGE